MHSGSDILMLMLFLTYSRRYKRGDMQPESKRERKKKGLHQKKLRKGW
jgi:hypothetical protein